MTSPSPAGSPSAIPSQIDLVLVRHAESLHNREGDKVRFDSGLTDLGWRQARAVAQWLAPRYRPSLLLSSPLMPTRQTAEMLAESLALPIVLESELNEETIQYWDELPHRWEHPLQGWARSWQPDGERTPLYSHFQTRLRALLGRVLVQRHPEQPKLVVVAVTYGGVIGTIMRSLFGGHQIGVFTNNTGVTQLSWQASHWRLVFHNSTGHLETISPQRSQSPAASVTNGERPNGADRRLLPPSLVQASNRATLGEREVRDLIRLAAPAGSEHLLDVLTGNGAVALGFAPHVALVEGIDPSPLMLERAEAARNAARQGNVYFRLGDVGLLALQDAIYDIVALHNMLHYVVDFPRLLGLVHRLLTRDGRLVLDELAGSEDPVKRATLNAIMSRREESVNEVLSAAEIETELRNAGFQVVKSERYTVLRDLDEWLGEAAADETTRSAVRSMMEAGLDADSAGLLARQGRDGAIAFTESRIRLIALVQQEPG